MFQHHAAITSKLHPKVSNIYSQPQFLIQKPPFPPQPTPVFTNDNKLNPKFTKQGSQSCQNSATLLHRHNLETQKTSAEV